MEEEKVEAKAHAEAHAETHEAEVHVEARFTQHYLTATSFYRVYQLPSDLTFSFKKLWTLHPVELGMIRMRGKIIKTPRWQQSYDLPYRFSGMLHDALPLPPEFQPFVDWANGLGFGPFNQKLVNWYKNGHHYIGQHSDDERQLVPGSPIVSISLGQQRKFRVKSRDATKRIAFDIDMANRSVIVMCGEFQKSFTHGVVKVSAKRGATIGPRINITLRQFVEV